MHGTCQRLFTAALILGAALGCAAAAAPAPLPVHRVPLDGALVQNTVTDILQDRHGLMWFGTLGGLNVYDGYAFREIPSDPSQPHGLSGTHVSQLFEDRDGFVWIAGQHGWLNRMDPLSGEVRRFPRTLYGSDELAAGPTAFLQQADGTLWIGTVAGLHQYQPGTDRLQLQVDARPGRAPLRGVRALAPADAGRLWLATGEGLLRFDPGSGALQRFVHAAGDPRSLPAGGVSSLHVDADGSVWVGTPSGLARFDGEERGFSRFVHDPSDPHSLGGNHVLALLRDAAGRLWVGGQSGGLSRLRADGRFDVYRHDPDDPQSLSVNDVWSLYQDRSGLLWIGTAGGGLNQLNPLRHRFQTLRAIPHQRDSLRSSFVWDLAEDRHGQLWMATLAGLERYDRRNGDFTLFEPVPGGVAANQLQSLAIDRQGRMWTGAVDGHLYRFEPGSGEFLAVPGTDGRSRFASGRIWYLGLDGAGRLLVATDDRVRVLDPDSAAIVGELAVQQQVGVGRPVRTSLVDSDGALWLGGGSGLLRIAGGDSQRIAHDPLRAQSLSENSVRALHEDAAGTLWVGTHNGLNRMEAADRRAGRNRFTRVTRANGLANDTVYGILPAADGALWLSTNRGLSRFDPASGAIRNFSSRDGLVSNEMNGGAELLTADGRLWFGGVGGVAHFLPQAIRPQAFQAPVRLTGAELAGHPFSAGLVLPDTGIAMAHDAGSLRLSFAAMDFHQPENHRFRYRLNGTAWIPAAGPSVSLAGLAPGRYRFEVQADDGSGRWGGAPAGVDIAVAPPPWQSPLAYLAYALLAALLLLGYHRAQRAKLARERAFNERLARAHSLAEANHQMALRYAQYDHLTQLPNRNSLTAALGRYLRFARAQGTPLALLLVNIDRFQRINDTLGHRLGDRLLRDTAARLQAVMGSDDFVARVGGDEFALVAVAAAGSNVHCWLSGLAERLAGALAEPHGDARQPLRLSASIGVATLADGAALTPGEMLSQADIAMHAVKRDGGNGIRRYAAGMLESARERVEIEERLRRAIAAGEFCAHYQPLVGLKDGRVAGFEALIRWNPPGEKPVFPDQFIPVAEESGLIVELGDWMLGEVCRQLAAWDRPDIRVAVNVSMRQLASGQLPRSIRGHLEASGVAASQLKLEITESAMMQNVEDTASQLREIRALGVAISIDDFGTGFSSLSHLRTLPVDEMKIDRGFVGDLGSSDRNRTIVASIVRLAHELGLAVVAEGVEDQGTLAYLQSLGCDLAQGYLFDRPLPAAQLRWHDRDQAAAARWFNSAARAAATA
jgi:diguanylate cyclase (GGDEF)-like protein